MSPTKRNPAFWQELDALIAGSKIVIDRPKGSVHPRCSEIVYPLDYGYLEGTTSPDGDGIDLWLGSHSEHRLRAILLIVDGEKRDSEIKLLLGCTDSEIETIYGFYNDYPRLKGLLIDRED